MCWCSILLNWDVTFIKILIINPQKEFWVICPPKFAASLAVWKVISEICNHGKASQINGMVKRTVIPNVIVKSPGKKYMWDFRFAMYSYWIDWTIFDWLWYNVSDTYMMIAIVHGHSGQFFIIFPWWSVFDLVAGVFIHYFSYSILSLFDLVAGVNETQEDKATWSAATATISRSEYF